MYLEKNALNAPKIRRLYAQGVEPDALCERFGISKSSLWKIVKNKYYADPNYTPPTLSGRHAVPRGQTREPACDVHHAG